VRFQTSLDRRLLELAIIVVAAHWRAEFEWWAHARMAREYGVDDASFARAVARLGRQGVVELASLCGYYTLVSFTLNTFAVPLPPGVAPAWPTSGDGGQVRSVSSDC